MPAPHQHGGFSVLVPLLLVATAMVAYLLLALRQQGGSRPWSWWRTAFFIAGGALLVLGLLPQSLPFPDGDFRNHMLQHLLIAMLAPIGLVMAAPMTLILRTVPTRVG